MNVTWKNGLPLVLVAAFVLAALNHDGALAAGAGPA
jgi:hypothetical protein